MTICPKTTDLARLLDGRLIGDPSTPINGISIDHRTVSAGSIFVCIRGNKNDSHELAAEAIAAGANAVLVEKQVAGISNQIVVADSRAALSALADYFSGSPSSSLKVVAVTGTNGKTTTNWLIHAALERLGSASLRVGTLGAYARGVLEDPDTLTTPPAIDLHRYFRLACDSKVACAVLETSSHAISQHRIDHIRPDVAIFTNLTRDHLDFHPTMEDYFLAKAGLFELLAQSPKSNRAAIINIDDEYGARLFSDFQNRISSVVSYGQSAHSVCRLLSFDQSADGGSILNLSYFGANYQIRSPLIGLYNGYNLLAAFSAVVALGFSTAQAVEAFTGLGGAPGRLEYLPSKGPAVFVDYAHTPDALARALEALKPITKGKLWVVFGCGGDRDRGKRPIMGELAARLADEVIVTSDNPRTEDPQVIISDILSTGIKPARIEVERREAIRAAIEMADDSDVILIAGKGHENYQIIGGKKFPFSDRKVALSFLRG